MANTKPISDLRNYNEVLRRIDVGNPVFLTENGRGRYAILDMREYERDQAEKALFARIAEAEMRVQSGESYLSADELKTKLGI